MKEKLIEGAFFFAQWYILSKIALFLGYELLTILICAWHVVGFIQYHYADNDSLLTSRVVIFNALWFIALIMTIVINVFAISLLLGATFFASRWILFSGENESCMKVEDIKKKLRLT